MGLRITAIIAGCMLFVAPRPVAAEVSGAIKSYECGDNCYLTITTEAGEEFTGLCAAEACQPWNDVTRDAEFLRRGEGARHVEAASNMNCRWQRDGRFSPPSP